jgi:hypothetical protein
MTTLIQRPTQVYAKATNPEIELLLCCARNSIAPEIAERIKILLQQNIDWSYLIEKAHSHGVLPLLYQSLKTTCPEAIPQSVITQLQNRYYANTYRNLLLSQELLNLLHLFKASEISVIPFKGVVLATSIYHNLTLRQFGDLDILVKPQDVVKVRELLITQGYQLDVDYGWQHTFIHQQKQIAVDLHWELTPLMYFPFQLPDFETLWQRSKSLTLRGQSVVDLCTDDLLIILAVQVARGGYDNKESLAQICDLAELIRIQQTLDWEKLLQQVRTLGVDRPFFMSLLLVKTLLNPPLPAPVYLAIQQQMQLDPVVSIYAVRMEKRLFSKVNSPLISKLFFQYLMIKGPLSRMSDHIYLLWQFLIFAVRFVITDINQADREFLPLPAALFFLYYFIRPLRLMGVGGLGI